MKIKFFSTVALFSSELGIENLQAQEYALPIRSVPTETPFVSLTFDDGNYPDVIEKFLNIADEYGQKFTLFPTGVNLINEPNLWREVKAAGHEIGNHSHFHRNVNDLNYQQILWDFRQFEEVDYPETFGEEFPTPGLARVPFAQGPVNRDVQRVIAELDNLHVHWKLDSYSWRHEGRNPDYLIRNVARAEQGDIVVLHLVDRDVDMIPRYLESLNEKGLENTTFSQLWESRENIQEEIS